MPSYLSPGVYIEEVPSGSKPIEAVGTSTAVFVGYATEGTFEEPTFVTSWEDYDKQFGGFREVQPDDGIPDHMGQSVFAFFQNGGSKAYIIRTAKEEDTAEGKLENGDSTLITFRAKSPGKWGNDVVVRIKKQDSDDDEKLFTVDVGTGTGENFVGVETFEDMSFDDDHANFIKGVLEDESALVSVSGDIDENTSNHIEGLSDPAEIEFSDGEDGTLLSGSDKYAKIFKKLLKYRDINIVLLPDLNYQDDGGIIDAAISHCEAMKNRMVIFDLKSDNELEDENEIKNLGLPTSSYAALYYPWPKVKNPFYNPEKNRSAPRLLSVPASAYAAGHWARTDSRRGVWKAPAGVESNLLGVHKLSYSVEKDEQEFLNPQGVNALRQLPNYGAVIWGARTRSTNADPEWRYIPVRRTAMFIEESIFNGIHWAVFEPNDHRLWSALRLNIESFMSGLHRSGAFQGEKSSDAYFVRCGLGQTMTQGDIDRGQVIVQVGFAPLKPAEFVIVRIQQKVGQQ